MTCIVAVRTLEGAVVMGCDSAASDGHRMYSVSTSKLVRLGNYALLGFTTSWRFGQLLRSVKVAPPTGDVEDWVIAELVPVLRQTMKDGGYATVHEGSESAGTALLAVGGRLFSIWNDYSVLERRCGYDAVGSGQDFAIAALTALVPFKQGKELVRGALRVAAEHSVTVEGPFHLQELRP